VITRCHTPLSSQGPTRNSGVTGADAKCPKSLLTTKRPRSVLPASDRRSVLGAEICSCARPEREGIERLRGSSPGSGAAQQFGRERGSRLGEGSGLSPIATLPERRDNEGRPPPGDLSSVRCRDKRGRPR
jgi:hypothetical protein